MTARDPGSRPRDRGRRSGPPPPPAIQPPALAPEPSLRERLARASVPALALLPLRFFLGATFVYAGVDKLLNPAFFDPGSPASIYAQLEAFARVSPVAFLVRPAEPFALPIGILIAIAEIAIGLGAITGLAFRLAAAGGAALSILFWLTASWATHPYYYGPDLPYAMGWLVLALAGDGGILVPKAVRELGRPDEDPYPAGARYGRRPQPVEDISAGRRQLLQAAALGAGALAVASVAVPVRLAVLGRGTGGDTALAPDGTAGAGSGTGVPGASEPATTPPNAPDDAAPPTSPPLAGLAIAKIADVDKAGAKQFHVPDSPSASLPTGDPGIIVKLADGTYAAYDATCTHEGCRVGWDAQDAVLLCPCHGAAFDPNDHGAVLGGPTNQPLLELPIVIDKQAGTISLRA